MGTTLDELIIKNSESLVDCIVKDAIGQIPSYSRAPLRTTMARVEDVLRAAADSIRENDPHILEQYLVGVAAQRREAGYAILELHAILHIIERHVQNVIARDSPDQIERNALLALLDAVMGAARMILSVRYLLTNARRT